MSNQEGLIELPKNVSITVGGKTFRGECPERFCPSKHRTAKPESKPETRKAKESGSKKD